MLPAWQAGAGKGYGRNFSSDAGLIPEQDLGWAGPHRLVCLARVKGPGRLAAPRFPAEHWALQVHRGLVTVQVLLKGLLSFWKAGDPHRHMCVTSAHLG